MFLKPPIYQSHRSSKTIVFIHVIFLNIYSEIQVLVFPEIKLIFWKSNLQEVNFADKARTILGNTFKVGH